MKKLTRMTDYLNYFSRHPNIPHILAKCIIVFVSDEAKMNDRFIFASSDTNTIMF